jgi:type I restriction enzyme S subunit
MSITDMTQDRRIIGYVGMFDSNRTDCIMSTHLMKIETPIDHHFILNFFNVSGLSKMIAEFATGANVLGLTDSILIRIKAVLPPNDLIEQYGKTVKPYYDMIAVLKNKNDNLIKQRDLLLPRLMSGKLEV